MENRKLTRCKKDRMIFGVCSGMAKYLDADPAVVRLLVIILSIFGLFGLFMYLIFALIMPPEDEG